MISVIIIWRCYQFKRTVCYGYACNYGKHFPANVCSYYTDIDHQRKQKYGYNFLFCRKYVQAQNIFFFWNDRHDLDILDAYI